MEGFSTVSRRSRQHRNGKQAGRRFPIRKEGMRDVQLPVQALLLPPGPVTCNVTAAVRIMKNATALEKVIPTYVSHRIRSSCAFAWRGAFLRGSSPVVVVTSSTSSEACHKNRSGEMVVPRTATNAAK